MDARDDELKGEALVQYLIDRREKELGYATRLGEAVKARKEDLDRLVMLNLVIACAQAVSFFMLLWLAGD